MESWSVLYYVSNFREGSSSIVIRHLGEHTTLVNAARHSQRITIKNTMFICICQAKHANEIAKLVAEKEKLPIFGSS